MSLRLRTRRTALVAALLATATTAGVLAVGSTAAAGDSFEVTSANPQNTDLDLGEPGPSAGDTQVFVDELRRDGRVVGDSSGACTLVLFTETRLVGSCATTMSFTDGSSLVLQGAFDEDPQVGPSGFRWAVTGGTGTYAGASGEAIGTFRPNSDIVDIQISLD
jgi:hypothetical protein